MYKVRTCDRVLSAYASTLNLKVSRKVCDTPTKGVNPVHLNCQWVTCLKKRNIIVLSLKLCVYLCNEFMIESKHKLLLFKL